MNDPFFQYEWKHVRGNRKEMSEISCRQHHTWGSSKQLHLSIGFHTIETIKNPWIWMFHYFFHMLNKSWVTNSFLQKRSCGWERMRTLTGSSAGTLIFCVFVFIFIHWRFSFSIKINTACTQTRQFFLESASRWFALTPHNNNGGAAETHFYFINVNKSKTFFLSLKSNVFGSKILWVPLISALRFLVRQNYIYIASNEWQKLFQYLICLIYYFNIYKYMNVI